MPTDEFWNGDVELVKAYRKAYEFTQQQWNVQAYLNGFYTYQAILRASPVLHAFAKRGAKPMPYLEKPIELGTKEKEQNKGRELQDKISNAFERFNKNFRKKKKQQEAASWQK